LPRNDHFIARSPIGARQGESGLRLGVGAAQIKRHRRAQRAFAKARDRFDGAGGAIDTSFAAGRPSTAAISAAALPARIESMEIGGCGRPRRDGDGFAERFTARGKGLDEESGRARHEWRRQRRHRLAYTHRRQAPPAW
jgi:hypothetical protein